MTEANALAQGQAASDDAVRAAKAKLGSMIKGMLDSKTQETMDSVLEVFNEVAAPQRDDVPEVPAPAAPAGVQRQRRDGTATIRLSSPTEGLYRNLSAEVREYRNPDSDFWMAQWMRARYVPGQGPNLEALRQAGEELARMFGYSVEEERALHEAYARVNLDEGAAGANFALSGGTGGAFLPRPIEALVFIERDRVAKMRRFARIYNLTRQQHQIPTAGSMTAEMVAEGAVSSATSNPTLAGIPLVAHKGQVRAAATIEMTQDSAFNLVQVFATRAGGALGVLEDDQFFRTGGGGAPNITAILAPGTVVTLTTNTLPYAKVVEIYFTVAQQYRSNARWFMSPDVLQDMSAVLDGANGRPFYVGLSDANAPLTDDPGAEGFLLRKPVYEVPAAAGFIWFGDVSQAYAVGSRTGIQTAVSEHTRWNEDAIEWKFTQRFDGNNVDAGASAGATDATGSKAPV